MDELRFDFGRICLDLLATTHPTEHLDSPDAVRTWIRGAGIAPSGTPLAAVGPDCVTALRQLRSDIGELFSRGQAAEPLARLNARAAAAPPVPRVVRTDTGNLIRALHPDPAGEALLAAVARDAVDLLTDPAARSRVRQCEGEGCPLLYLDTSRGRRRRWCSSEVCGNRVRVARHRRRSTARSL
ncbi:ABATE domain-containing protein [Streptomyces sp. LHD-70]|uniref:CGNR zinc finger domain-containing protein n=1 Tax=Streptomyces sp. LHD-70 TaxID=3072140 RepID=UPI00280FF39A|nr:ABATE domain-containing protein [Streptomyces sp. LHD-70]MDQ8705779.1 ABATE domain-containing protein [Streptomyces sp. LHD-70]